MKKTMGPPQQDRKGKSSQQRTKKARPEKIRDRDRSEVPALATTPRVSFMDLSGELRNQIYREVLHFEDEIMIGHGDENGDRSDSRAKMPSLLQISSQIRKEAISIYYGENTFICNGEIPNHDDEPAKPICTAVHFRKWCEDMGAENIKWIKKLEVKPGGCWICRAQTPPWLPSSMCDIYPYVEFAIKYPNCELVLRELRPPHDSWVTCTYCCTRTGTPMDSVLLSERMPIIKEPAWVEEIAAGNIVKIMAFINKVIRINKVIYAREASNRTNGEYKWQELCDKLSLNYPSDFTILDYYTEAVLTG